MRKTLAVVAFLPVMGALYLVVSAGGASDDTVNLAAHDYDVAVQHCQTDAHDYD